MTHYFLLTLSCLALRQTVLAHVPFLSSHAGSPLLNVNDFLDDIASQAQNALSNSDLDPLKLPDGTESFSKKVWLVRFYGDAKYYNGQLYGLSSIHRDGGDNHVTLSSSAATLDGNLGFQNLIASYSASASFMGVRIAAHASVTITNSNIHIRASQNLRNFNPEGHLILDSFEITDLGEMDVSLSALGPLDWILEQLSGTILNEIRPTLRDAISKEVKGVLEKELAKVNIPDHILQNFG